MVAPPSSAGRASVVVRTKNEETEVVHALESLRSQSVALEVVLVDSGSTDRTVELAKPYCDQVVELTPERWSYGRALNAGVARSRGDVVFALSAHCRASDPLWAERHLHHYSDERVAGVFGTQIGPLGEPLEHARHVRLDDVRTNPHWGFSNHASSWRRSVWEQLPFDEAMPSCEDKQWMWRVLMACHAIVADPAVAVNSSHRRQAGLRALWRREVAEHEAVAQALDYPLPTSRQLLAEWWSSFPWPSPRPRWQRLFSPYRTVEIVGGHFGDRAGAARRDGSTLRLGRR